jgi:hypothetical protein
MYYGYVDIANIAQKLPMTESEKIYTIYKTMLPKKKMFLKYIKSKNKKSNKELLQYISEYFKCSFREADNYITILKNKGVKSILEEMGINEKEIKKLLKK